MRNKLTSRTCVICGQSYIPTAYNQQRCQTCARSNLHKCQACGTVFTSPAKVGYRKLCDACVVFNREAVARNRLSPQSAEARLKKKLNRDHDQDLRNMANAKSTEAFHQANDKNSPLHSSSKIYTLISPDGTRFELRNLNAFLRAHPEWFPNFEDARKRFVEISRSHRDPSGKFIHRYTYHGWSMERAPEIPADIAARSARRAIINRKRAEREGDPEC